MATWYPDLPFQNENQLNDISKKLRLSSVATQLLNSNWLYVIRFHTCESEPRPRTPNVPFLLSSSPLCLASYPHFEHNTSKPNSPLSPINHLTLQAPNSLPYSRFKILVSTKTLPLSCHVQTWNEHYLRSISQTYARKQGK